MNIRIALLITAAWLAWRFAKDRRAEWTTRRLRR